MSVENFGKRKKKKGEKIKQRQKIMALEAYVRLDRSRSNLSVSEASACGEIAMTDKLVHLVH